MCRKCKKLKNKIKQLEIELEELYEDKRATAVEEVKSEGGMARAPTWTYSEINYGTSSSTAAYFTDGTSTGFTLTSYGRVYI